ncbi:MAG TPA: DUF882 domain-containing protein [Gemmatimonadaceae bacterium]
MVISLLAALGYIAFLRPAAGLGARSVRLSAVVARPAADAFGRSGQVRMRFALPLEPVDYPLEVQTGLEDLRYSWVPVNDTIAIGEERLLLDGLTAPGRPGFYRLELSVDQERKTVDGLSLAVLVPRSEKKGSTLNGYRMGFYRGDRARPSDPEAPVGFVEIDTAHVLLPVSQHFRLGDFITRDNQSTWPRYVALDPRLLDKVELVLAEISTWTGGPTPADLTFDVRSAFRTPLHNRLVPTAARDSRHQLGDAIDLAVDANRDGRVNSRDTRLVGMAVEIVERQHPDLVGGMGIYTRTGLSYVHIDARGARVRWRG